MTEQANEVQSGDRVYTFEGAAKRAGRSRTWLRIAVLAGRIVPSVTVGGTSRRMFSEADVTRIAQMAGTDLAEGASGREG
jgi:hypothetical protein